MFIFFNCVGITAGDEGLEDLFVPGHRLLDVDVVPNCEGGNCEYGIGESLPGYD